MISVIVPAHNEENYIGDCLKAIRQAETRLGSMVEIVVVLNRCTDKTEGIANQYGAICIKDSSRCIAMIRNQGVMASSHSIIVTCDADSRMPPDMLAEVSKKLLSGLYIGGGVPIIFDRRSRGIRFTEKFLDMMVKLTGIPCGAFWTTRHAFDAIGGFNEELSMGEDVDFGKRLAKWGKQQRLVYGCLEKNKLLTSSRKFDHYGDWSFFRMMTLDAWKIYRSIKKHDTQFVDEYFYDFNDRHKKD